MNSQIFKRRFQRSKFIGLKLFLYHWKAIEISMFKMSLYDPFGHLKHKLWPKEKSGVKLAVWLPTIKNHKLTQFPYVQVACNIPLEKFQWGLQLCLRPYLNPRFAHKVIRPQSRENPNFGNFETPIWELGDKMTFECGPRGEAQSIL
jgi:hypothetical protein